MKIDGIQGESQDSKHKNEIHLMSWSWGETNRGGHSTGGGGGAGKVEMQDFHFTMNVNKASPKLFLACASGQHIKEAMLVCRKAGKDQQEYLKIKFQELLISSYQTGGSDAVPVEQIGFNFAKIEIQYCPQKSDGTLDALVVANWSQKEAKGG